MKNIEEFDQFLKTLSIRTPIEALGWDSVIQDVELASAGDQMFVYVHDVATRFTWMASIERNGFHRAAELGGKLLKDKRMKDVRGGLLAAVMQLSGSIDAVGSTKEAEHVLGVAISLYAGTTQTFQAADRFKDGGHFCVMIYRKDAKSESANIRPFAFPGAADKPLDTDSFMEAVAQVEQRDRALHPEWME